MTIRKAQNNTVNTYINTKAFHTQPPTIWLHTDTCTLTLTSSQGHTHTHDTHTHTTHTHTRTHACTHAHTIFFVFFVFKSELSVVADEERNYRRAMTVPDRGSINSVFDQTDSYSRQNTGQWSALFSLRDPAAFFLWSAKGSIPVCCGTKQFRPLVTGF